MLAPVQKNQNERNIFLNEYFHLILAVFVILILAFSYFLVLKPKYDETLLSIQSNIDRQRLLYSEQKKKLNGLKVMNGLYNQINPVDLEKFNGVLPDNLAGEALYGEFGEMVAENGFILDSVSIITPVAASVAAPVEGEAAAAAAPSQAENVGSIDYEVKVSAIDYNGFKNLLKLFEANLRLFDVTGASFSPAENTASFNISAYYYKQP